VSETKDRILDAAELLFARQGVGATSLRSVTSEARVNGAAIHYHFGSKGELVQALIERRIAPINAERLERLDALERDARGAGVALEPLLRAFLEPMIAGPSGLGGGAREPRLGGLFAWLHADEDADLAPIRAQFDQVKRRFAKAIASAAPGVDSATAGEWLDYAMGAGLQIVAALHARGSSDAKPALDRLLVFLVGAFEAASAKHAPRRGARRSARAAGRRA